jgi:hypothetical protein
MRIIVELFKRKDVPSHTSNNSYTIEGLEKKIRKKLELEPKDEVHVKIIDDANYIKCHECNQFQFDYDSSRCKKFFDKGIYKEVNFHNDCLLGFLKDDDEVSKVNGC